MDPNNPHSYNTLEWQIIEDEINDNYEEERMRFILEKRSQREAESSTRRRHTRIRIKRNREAGHDRLFNDYFPKDATYPDGLFRRRFRMRKHLFVRIMEGLGNHDEYFTSRVDATRRISLSPLQKCNASIRMLANGSSADSIDGTVRIGKSIAVECLGKFVKDVNKVFGPEYLRRPNSNNIQYLLQIGEKRGFPGMLGSIDCMHWQWKNCPVAWKGKFYRGDHGKTTIMLEAVASKDLWIWHAFFGTAGSNNDINVLNQSDVFNDIMQGKAPEVKYTVNGTQYNMGYYLADGIYPE